MEIVVARADVRPGEAWAEAADRQVDTGTGPVLAVDLSGDPLRFRTSPDRLAVRPMTPGDLGDVRRWVGAEHVARWWGPWTPGGPDRRQWIWEVNGRSVGFGQDYRIGDHPEFALLSGREDAVGFDYLIGEASYVARGLGTSLLWVYLRDIVVPSYDGVSELFAAPDHRNTRSLRVLDKLGATRGLWFDEPRADGGVDTMVGCSIDVRRALRS